MYHPQIGGRKIPKNSHDRFLTRVRAFERSQPWYPKTQLRLRFNGQFCYIEMIKGNETEPSPFLRLRYFDDERWSMAFYTWSHERYEPCTFSKGGWEGTLEEAIATCEPFLDGSPLS